MLSLTFVYPTDTSHTSSCAYSSHVFGVLYPWTILRLMGTWRNRPVVLSDAVNIDLSYLDLSQINYAKWEMNQNDIEHAL